MSNEALAGLWLVFGGVAIALSLWLDSRAQKRKRAAREALQWRGLVRVVKRHRQDGKWWWAVEERGCFDWWLVGHYDDEKAATAKAQAVFDAIIVRTEVVSQ